MARADDEGDDAGDAQPSEAAQLFTRGRELMKSGNATDACPLFEQSLRLQPALGTELNLALCLTATGKLVAARKQFEDLARDADAQNQPQRAELARQGLDALARRMPSLVVAVGALPVDTIVTVDGVSIAVGRPVPMDPGAHELAAHGARTVKWTAREGARAEITLEAVPERERPREVYIAGGIAIGALFTALVTGETALRERDTATSKHCQAGGDPLVCDQRGVDLLNRAHAMSHVTTAFLVVGIGAAATAVVLELRSRSREVPPLVIAPSPDGGGSVSYVGTF